jgi:hypothetical protein
MQGYQVDKKQQSKVQFSNREQTKEKKRKRKLSITPWNEA